MKTTFLKLIILMVVVWICNSTAYATESGYQGLLVKPAKSLNPQSMVDHKGQAINFPQKNGNMKFVFFGYTSCPDVCPMTLSRIKQLIKKLGPTADKLEYYFVSIDPQRDNTEQLKHFVSYYDKSITGLTGKPRSIKALENEFGILTRKFQGKSAFAYTLEHSVFIYLLDEQGRLRVMYPASTPVNAIISDIELLRKNNNELVL